MREWWFDAVRGVLLDLALFLHYEGGIDEGWVLLRERFTLEF
jgi:hypothetical protein